MQYSPKLKKAMEQIKNILKENDIAGFVVLHTPGFSEYLNHFETSYSCAKLVDGDVMLKINSKEIGIDKARIIARDSLNMMTHLAKATGEHAMLYINAEKILKDKFGGEDLPGEETSHIQQNN